MKSMKLNLLLFFTLLMVNISFAQSTDTAVIKKRYFTKMLNSEVKLDGKIDEDAWNEVAWEGDFIQNKPNEGQAPSQPTQFKIAYDEKHLYIAYKCIDTAPDSIVKRMSRRDEFPGDWMEINIDSYHDLRTAFSFTISASGVRGDEAISNNGGNWDDSWNPIWHAKTSSDQNGWYAEVAIPFSQLRFGNEVEKVWGIQVQRRFFRKEERSLWQFIPQKSGVWVSGFGELHGIKNIQPRKQIEVAPYTVAKLEKYRKEEGNPFATGLDSKVTVGVDGKAAITSDLIVDFTVNPDFGQVEADPSQVRIDGFQNFFRERRPFFVESRNIFDYQLTNSEVGFDFDSDLLFYSRRIGSSPHGYVNLNQNEYASIPVATPILGAVKLSGKTAKGWSIGFLESITKNVYAKVEREGKRTTELIEPLTNFLVGRLQKDFNGGQTVIGGIVTAVNRNNDLNESLHKSAYSGGLDFQHFWKERTWYIKGNTIFSTVNGTKNKITETQNSFEHLFQRTNATEVSVDTSLTSLTGTGATFKIGKNGGKAGKYGEVYKFESGFTYRSPDLEVNDIGFMLAANEIHQFNWAGVQFQQPIGMFRQGRANINNVSKWDFGGQFLFSWFNTNLHGTFKNNWSIGTGFNFVPHNISNTALRGGSSLRSQSVVNNWFYVESDSRKKITLSLEGFNSKSSEKSGRASNYSLGMRIQPFNALSINLNANFNMEYRLQDQFAASAFYNGSPRFIVSELNQKTISFTMRMSYNLSPDLTLQYYGQPFITRPLYTNFAFVTDALNKDFNSRFHTYTAEEIKNENGVYLIDENRDGNTDYSFGSPDFNYVQFRSNLVLRWEYKAGSEFYLVWSQNNSPNAFADLKSNITTSLFDNAFSGDGKNIFLMKMTYRFLR
jgi:Domain of unknown function (DUF5916)/Carbohydrate family 9 binding domain-like